MKEETPKIRAIISTPRLAFTEQMFCAFRAFPPLGIPIVKQCGAFWGQGMSRLLYDAVDAGEDYCIAVDYDSVYAMGDVLELIRLIKTKPGALAVFPMQLKRNHTDVLAGLIPEKDGSINLNQELMPCKSGHFGLTIIDLKVLKETMPHPWLMGLPEEKSGKWVEGRVDDDIYFWNKAYDLGLKIYLAPLVKIGHIQQMISWVDKDLKIVHQYLTDYENSGCIHPAGV